MESKRLKERTEQVVSRLAEADADGIILSTGEDQQYLAGNTEKQTQPRHTFFVISNSGDVLFFIPENNAPNVIEKTWVENIVTWSDQDDPIDKLRPALSDIGLTKGDTVMVNDHMWAAFVQDLQQIFDTKIRLASDIIMNLRMQKDKEEINKIKEAAKISDAVCRDIRKSDVIGLTEAELVAEIEYRIKKRGGDVAFNTMVASGPNSGKPSYTQGNRVIQPSDPVVLDFGAAVDGYTSDQARTIVFKGTPSDEFRSAFDAVREAQQAAVEAIEPGKLAKEIDVVARKILDDYGYGENFLHVSGHGIGLNIHEPPYLMSGEYLNDGNLIELKEGMVVTVEPGVYTDEWGIRIEDDVLITPDGGERLTDTSREWKPL